MAKENHIGREVQDEFAHRSHVRAAQAWGDGKFDDEVMEVFIPNRYTAHIRQDNNIRKDSQIDNYSKLKTIFDRSMERLLPAVVHHLQMVPAPLC